jgi:hypothetical protein
VALWATLSSIFTVTLLVPLLVGRAVLDPLLPSTLQQPLHDGYAWFLGAILVGASLQLAKTARRIIRSSHREKRLMRVARRVGEYAWYAVFISWTSCLLGVSVELYLNGMLTVRTHGSTLPDISLLHAFSMGLLLQYTIVAYMEIRGGGTNIQYDWEKVPFGASAFCVIREVSEKKKKQCPFDHP